MVAWHPHEEILASASYDDTVKIWRDEEDDWFCADTLQGHTSTVWALDFNASGDHIGKQELSGEFYFPFLLTLVSL